MGLTMSTPAQALDAGNAAAAPDCLPVDGSRKRRLSSFFKTPGKRVRMSAEEESPAADGAAQQSPAAGSPAAAVATPAAAVAGAPGTASHISRSAGAGAAGGGAPRAAPQVVASIILEAANWVEGSGSGWEEAAHKMRKCLATQEELAVPSAQAGPEAVAQRILDTAALVQLAGYQGAAQALRDCLADQQSKQQEVAAVVDGCVQQVDEAEAEDEDEDEGEGVQQEEVDVAAGEGAADVEGMEVEAGSKEASEEEQEEREEEEEEEAQLDSDEAA